MPTKTKETEPEPESTPQVEENKTETMSTKELASSDQPKAPERPLESNEE